jgi:hypothetical protein
MKQRVKALELEEAKRRLQVWQPRCPMISYLRFRRNIIIFCTVHMEMRFCAYGVDGVERGRNLVGTGEVWKPGLL